MIGRKKEATELNRLYQTRKAEFVAIYGRRRIGKTYLVDEVFKNKFSFRHAGLSPAESNDEQQGQLRSQLEHFYNSLKLYGMEGAHCPSSWLPGKFSSRRPGSGRCCCWTTYCPSWTINGRNLY